MELIKAKHSGKTDAEGWPIWETWGGSTVDDGNAPASRTNASAVIGYSSVRTIELKPLAQA